MTSTTTDEKFSTTTDESLWQPNCYIDYGLWLLYLPLITFLWLPYLLHRSSSVAPLPATDNISLASLPATDITSLASSPATDMASLAFEYLPLILFSGFRQPAFDQVLWLLHAVKCVVPPPRSRMCGFLSGYASICVASILASEAVSSCAEPIETSLRILSCLSSSLGSGLDL